MLASPRLDASTIEPVSTTGNGPKRSDKVPQIMLVNAIARKPMVMALEMPVTDQPVSRAIGCKNTGSENIPPIATQPSRPPAATITQRYCKLVISWSPGWLSCWKTNGDGRKLQRLLTFLRADQTRQSAVPKPAPHCTSQARPA